MKIISAFAEPSDWSDRSIKPADFSFPIGYPFGSLFPPGPLEGFLLYSASDPLSRVRRGFAPFPCPLPELSAMPLMEELDLLEDCPESPGATLLEASAEPTYEGVHAAVRHCITAHGEIVALVELRQSTRTFSRAEKELCGALLDQCDELDALMTRLLDLADRADEIDESASGPAASPESDFLYFPRNPNRQRRVLLPARRCLQTTNTKNERGSKSAK